MKAAGKARPPAAPASEIAERADVGEREVPRESGRARRAGPERRVATRNRLQTPIDRYFARDEIDERLWRAGERFRQLAHDAALARSLTSRYGLERIDGGGAAWFGGIAPNERAAAARGAMRLALAAVGGPLGPILIEVLITGRSAGDWSRARGRPAAHGLPTLIVALEALAAHFGID